jgi:2-(3-amino-3-carboxypropyl)histidine synthase
MKAARRKAVEAARGAARWAVVLGTLGRQGNPRILEALQQHMAERGIAPVVVLLSETTPHKLAMIGHVDAWVQVGAGGGWLHHPWRTTNWGVRCCPFGLCS